MMGMNMVVFDTLKLSQKLEGAGFTREQATGAAKALSDTFTDSVATKGDVDAVRKDVKVESDKLRGEMREMENRIDGKFEAVKGDIRAVRGEMREMEGRIDGKFEAVKGDIREMESRIDVKLEAVKGEMCLIRWMLALVVAATVIPLVRSLL